MASFVEVTDERATRRRLCGIGISGCVVAPPVHPPPPPVAFTNSGERADTLAAAACVDVEVARWFTADEIAAEYWVGKWMLTDDAASAECALAAAFADADPCRVYGLYPVSKRNVGGVAVDAAMVAALSRHPRGRAFLTGNGFRLAAGVTQLTMRRAVCDVFAWTAEPHVCRHMPPSASAQAYWLPRHSLQSLVAIMRGWLHLATGLMAYHEAGLTHLDIRAENVVCIPPPPSVVAVASDAAGCGVPRPRRCKCDNAQSWNLRFIDFGSGLQLPHDHLSPEAVRHLMRGYSWTWPFWVYAVATSMAAARGSLDCQTPHGDAAVRSTRAQQFADALPAMYATWRAGSAGDHQRAFELLLHPFAEAAASAAAAKAAAKHEVVRTDSGAAVTAGAGAPAVTSASAHDIAEAEEEEGGEVEDGERTHSVDVGDRTPQQRAFQDAMAAWLDIYDGRVPAAMLPRALDWHGMALLVTNTLDADVWPRTRTGDIARVGGLLQCVAALANWRVASSPAAVHRVVRAVQRWLSLYGDRRLEK